jgi:hypothetical protein
MSNANPLDYDAKYPQKADSSVNEEARLEVLKKNIGREVMIKHPACKDCIGKITDVTNEGYFVEADNAKFIMGEANFNFVDTII